MNIVLLLEDVFIFKIPVFEIFFLFFKITAELSARPGLKVPSKMPLTAWTAPCSRLLQPGCFHPSHGNCCRIGKRGLRTWHCKCLHPSPLPKSPSLLLKIRENFCNDSWDTTTFPLSGAPRLLAWFLIHINVVFYCCLIINGILFAYLTLLLTSVVCVCAHVSPGMISPQHPPN